MTIELIQVAQLSYYEYELAGRIYSIDGLSPSIRTPGGSGHEPKILIKGGPE